MNRLTVGLLKVFQVKSGHRVVDAFGKGFTQGHFALACDSAPAINPYKLATPGTPNTTTYGVFPGTHLLIRENPHQPDPEDDPRNNTDEASRHLAEVVQGRAVEVDSMTLNSGLFKISQHSCSQLTEHKTSTKYTLWVFFSDEFKVFLMYYQDLVMKSNISTHVLSPRSCF